MVILILRYRRCLCQKYIANQFEQLGARFQDGMSLHQLLVLVAVSMPESSTYGLRRTNYGLWLTTYGFTYDR